MGIFDNSTNSKDIDLSSRRTTVEMNLIVRALGNLTDLASNHTYLDSLRFGGEYDIDMQLPNYAVFNDDNSTFDYSLKLTDVGNSTKTYRFVMEFKGRFDSVNYDPQLGVLVGSSGKDRTWTRMSS